MLKDVKVKKETPQEHDAIIKHALLQKQNVTNQRRRINAMRRR